MAKNYLDVDVLTAARERIAFVFDRFPKLYVSFSGGKDSTVLLNLAIEVAREKGRLPVDVLIVDLEAQYANTVDFIARTVRDNPDAIRAHWVCLPLNLRNAVSQFESHWSCWDPEARARWVRELPSERGVISDPAHFPFWRHRMEFEEFVPEFHDWFSGGEPTACLVGIRADESLNRYKAVAERIDGTEKVSRYVGEDGVEVNWGTVLCPATPHLVSFYPVYDWRTKDVWTAIGKFGWDYNRIYDLMHLAGTPLSQMRICQPYGDDQRRGLDLWHQLEPETWNAVLERVCGADYGARYAGQKLLGYHRGTGLPDGHTWQTFTHFLLSTLPDVPREKYLANFAVFIEWWSRNGFPTLDSIPDDETELLKTSDRRRLPSWRRLGLSVLKGDFNGKSLSIGPVKDIFGSLYKPVSDGGVAVVRKSVKPTYALMREWYAAEHEQARRAA